MRTYRLVISSPDGTVFDGDAVNLCLRGANGDLAVMANHAPFITSVKPCECKVELPEGVIKMAQTDGGLLTVDNEKVTLLSGSFKWKTE